MSLKPVKELVSSIEYTKRNQGLWISEAIVLLLDEDSGLVQVGLGSKNAAKKRHINITLTKEGIAGMVEIMKLLRVQTPLIEGLRTKIIIAAIRHRLSKNSATAE